MLQMPEETSGHKEVPCYRCLFYYTFTAQSCDPNKCMMLNAWLYDNDFSWAKYETKWLLDVEQQNINKLHAEKNELV